MNEEYIMTATELDEQFVDNMADLSINNPEYMTDEERDEANDFDLADEEIEEDSYQMTDEEQKGFEQYLVDTREDVPECTDAKVSLLWDTIAGYSSPRQRAEEIAEEIAEEKAERLDTVRRAKETQRLLDRNPMINIGVSDGDIEKLTNHFNA